MIAKKPIIIFVAVCFMVVAAFAGLKMAKKIRRELKKPRAYDARPLIAQLKGPGISEDTKIFVASSLDRVFKDGYTLLKPSFALEAKLSAARHEYENFQIIIDSKKDLYDVRVTVTDLQNTKTRARILKDHISWREVGYVETKTPYYPVKRVGLWPDPLLVKSSLDVKAGEIQPIWITVYVPQDVPAGDYEGSVTVQAHAIEPVVIPMKVKVYDFNLPVENHLKTAFDFYGHITRVRYPQGANESDEAYRARIDHLNDQYLRTMLKYRMNPLLNIDPTSQADLGTVDSYRMLGLNNFSIGKRGGTFDNNWPKDDASIEKLLPTYRGYGENLTLNGLLPYTYIYTWDEGDMGNPLVAKLTNMIHRAHPGLKNMVCYHGIWDPETNPEWGKDIDIWTFQIDKFNQKNFDKLKKMGIEMWMYISGPGGYGTPNLAMDFDSIDYRIVPWICWKFDIRGFLYWCVNWWPNVDPFKSAVNSQWQQNGNGLLFYPGPTEPWVSLRMEIFRDGMEDYEYIQALIERLRILKSKGSNAAHEKYIEESKRLLTMDNALIKDLGNFNRDGDNLKKRRDAIAEKIEEFESLM